jgi:Predicted membrane protein (DUF2207) N-terminal domain
VKRVRLLFAASLPFAAVALGVPSSAGAQGYATESTPRFDVRIDIESDGSIAVAETIVQDFGDVPRHGIFRTIPNRVPYDEESDRVYPIELVSVRASQGTPSDVQTSEEAGHFIIRIGDPDVTITGRHTYSISYVVDGALNDFPTHQELYWNAIGDDWEQPIGEMRVRVAGPGPIERVACFQGPFGSTLECDRARIKDGVATFVQEGLDAFTAMSIVAALPPGTVTNALPILEERWSLQRAFSVTPLTLVASLALLVAVVAGFSRFAWRCGLDV